MTKTIKIKPMNRPQGIMSSATTSLFGVSLLTLGALLILVPPAPISSLPWVIVPVECVFMGIGLFSLGTLLKRGYGR
jgi:hypothetical protein